MYLAEAQKIKASQPAIRFDVLQRRGGEAVIKETHDTKSIQSGAEGGGAFSKLRMAGR